MKKSEKILISLVAVAGIYGLGDYFLRSSLIIENDTEKPVSSNQQLELISTELSEIAVKESAALASLSAEITKPWNKAIFLHKKMENPDLKSSTEDQTAAQDDIEAKLNGEAQSLSYSGYLTMGNISIAIIDGQDYRKNETINGFTVESIHPEAIRLSKSNFKFTVNAKKENNSRLYSRLKEQEEINTVENK